MGTCIVKVEIGGQEYSTDLVKFKRKGRSATTIVDKAIDDLKEQAGLKRLPSDEKVRLFKDIWMQT